MLFRVCSVLCGPCFDLFVWVMVRLCFAVFWALCCECLGFIYDFWCFTCSFICCLDSLVGVHMNATFGVVLGWFFCLTFGRCALKCCFAVNLRC